MRSSARISVFKTLSATTGCSKGAQLDEPAAFFCKSATSPEHPAPTPRTVRWRYLVPRHLCFHTPAASTSIGLDVIRSSKLTASRTLPTGRNANAFVVLQLIAETGLFMVTSAFFTQNVFPLDLVVRIIAGPFSLIFLPAMCFLMITNLVTLETSDTLFLHSLQ